MSPRGERTRRLLPRAPRASSFRKLSVTYEGHSEAVATRPPDLSAQGMFINTAREFPEGAVLNVRFRLGISGVEIRARAEVRYCLPGVGVGVEFVEISSAAVQAIEDEMAHSTSGGVRGRRRRSKYGAGRILELAAIGVCSDFPDKEEFPSAVENLHSFEAPKCLVFSTVTGGSTWQ